MPYHGKIVARVPAALPALVGRQSGWTCEHSHREHSAAFECAVKYARAHALKSVRGMRSNAAVAGIRELTITVVEA